MAGPVAIHGGTVAINAIHLDHLPEMDYADLWWERCIRSVANVTRDDARDYLALAASIPVVTTIEEHPLADANRALQEGKMLLELQPKARIRGDVFYGALEMHEGALIDGRLTPMLPEEKHALKLAANNA
mgnify:CR=1 FL=1